MSILRQDASNNNLDKLNTINKLSSEIKQYLEKIRDDTSKGSKVDFSDWFFSRLDNFLRLIRYDLNIATFSKAKLINLPGKEIIEDLFSYIRTNDQLVSQWRKKSRDKINRTKPKFGLSTCMKFPQSDG